MNTKWKIIKTGITQYRAFKKFSRLSDAEKNISPLPEQFVADILELGPVFIKIGQILSTRPDILPVQYITALEKLQENVPLSDFTVRGCLSTLSRTWYSKTIRQTQKINHTSMM